MNISAEQLQQVAVRLGYTDLRYSGIAKFDVLGFTGDGSWYPFGSDGDLLLACLNRAAEMGYTLELRVYKSGASCKAFDEHYETTQFHRAGSDALGAAIATFIQLPIHASQGDA